MMKQMALPERAADREEKVVFGHAHGQGQGHERAKAGVEERLAVSRYLTFLLAVLFCYEAIVKVDHMVSEVLFRLVSFAGDKDGIARSSQVYSLLNSQFSVYF